ncbi:hypothetical protein BGAL_0049g00270 [Botrytis galanthina]|uniref:Uncharacterized protein n=1 Tax=Botrytis galanthina TaxID=278940 RepID=A0A4S8R915_9HELO|nr:hypothetical protein BGAL_0049g00270 [Botrytis galanthina]
MSAIVPSDVEITPAAYDGHDADIPSNGGYILNANERIKRKQVTVLYRKLQRRQKIHAQASRDVENLSQQNNTKKLDPNIFWWDGPDDLENSSSWKG